MGLGGTKSNLSPDAAQYLATLENKLKTVTSQIPALVDGIAYLKKRVANGDTTIPDGSVTTAKIADGAVTDAKIIGIDSTKIVGDVSSANTVSSAAYVRNAVGSGFFAVWMNSSYQLMRNTSSRRYKEDIGPYKFDPKNVLALADQIVQYHRIGSDERSEVGLIAEDAHKVVPEIVTWYAEPDVDEGGNAIPGISTNELRIDGVRYDLIALALLSVVADQEARIAVLEAKI